MIEKYKKVFEEIGSPVGEMNLLVFLPKIWVYAAIPLIFCCLQSCKKDMFVAEKGEAQFLEDKVYVPEAKIYSMGQVYEELAPVRRGQIAFVELDGKYYFIYNESDTVVKLNKETSALSLYKRMIRYYEYNNSIGSSSINGSKFLDLCNLWKKYDYSLKTGLKIIEGEDRVYITNCKMRTAFVESENDSAYLLPRNLNIIDIIGSLVGSTSETELQVEDTIKSYGSIIRLFLIRSMATSAMLDSNFVKSVNEAYNSNSGRFVELNALDLFIAVNEILHETFGIVLDHCGELIYDVSIGAILEGMILYILSKDTESATSEALKTANQTVDDLIGCVIEAGSVSGSEGVLVVLYEIKGLLDILATLATSWVGGLDVATTLAYDWISLSFPFKITQGYYSENDNLEDAVQSEFGNNYRIADWNDVVSYCQTHSAQAFIDQLNWELGEENSLMVTWNGEHFWDWGNRHYYISRFDHNVPSHYLVHDDIEDGYITLGSWYNLHMRVLAIRR